MGGPQVCSTLMHARELAELAALIAVHSGVIVNGAGQVPDSTSEQYWAASKCRFDRWGRILRQLAAAACQPQLPATLAWPRVRPILEEILISELLTRLWAATAAAYDAAREQQELEPVARNILTGHLEARRRVLSLISDGRVIELREAVRLNQIRRRVERWTDMLLAHLAGAIEIDEFAFEADRAREFAADLDHEAVSSQRRFTCQLMLASLKASFADGLDDRPANQDLNRRIGAAVLAAFREEITDSTGLVKSLWLQRLSQTASDTEGMIEDLLRLDRDLPVVPRGDRF
jgi:hypothetical protein